MTYYQAHRQAYLLVHREPRLTFTTFLDTRPEVLNWYAVLPNTLLLVSEQDLSALANLIHTGLPSAWFILVPIDGKTTQGFMNPETWEFVNNPKSSGRWAP